MATTTTWIVLEKTDLLPYLVAAQVSAMTTAALAPGQADPFDDIMPDVVADIRGSIATCVRNGLSATANAIPPEFKMHAAYMLLEAMQLRLPSLKLTDEQKAAAERGRKRLEKIAACEIAVSQPDDAEANAFGGTAGVEVVTRRQKVATAAQLDGL